MSLFSQFAVMETEASVTVFYSYQFVVGSVLQNNAYCTLVKDCDGMFNN